MSDPKDEKEFLSDTAYGTTFGIILGVAIIAILGLIYIWFHDVRPKSLSDVGPGLGTLLYFLLLTIVLCYVLAKDIIANSKLEPGAKKNRNFLPVFLSGLLVYLIIVYIIYGHPASDAGLVISGLAQLLSAVASMR